MNPWILDICCHVNVTVHIYLALELLCDQFSYIVWITEKQELDLRFCDGMICNDQALLGKI